MQSLLDYFLPIILFLLTYTITNQLIIILLLVVANTIPHRYRWFIRSPFHRIIWFIAKLFGFIATTIRYWILGKPIGVDRYQISIIEKEAFQRLIKPNPKEEEEEEKPISFQNIFHRQAIPIIVKDFLSSEIQDFVFALPLAAILERKLAIQHAIHQNLAIPELPLTIVIVGLPRTGSTRFHQLCGLHPTLRTIQSWEFKMPVELLDAPADIAARKIKTQNMLDFFYKWAPSIRAVHYVRHDDPDECVQGFMDCTFPENYLWGAVDAPNAYEWYMNHDMTEQYKNYINLLRVVLFNDNNNTNKKTLILKSPHHTVKLPEIVKAFNDNNNSSSSSSSDAKELPSCPNTKSKVKFIWLHRDFAESVGSCCSMNQAILDVISSQYIDSHELGQRTLNHLVKAIAKGKKDRLLLEQQQGIEFVDVQYQDFKQNEIQTVENALQQLGIQTTPEQHEEFIKNIEIYDKKNKELLSLWKEHKYDLKYFGLDIEQVRRKFTEI
jgi:hypothetical protein